MPSDQHDEQDIGSNSGPSLSDTYVDLHSGRLMRGTEEVDLFEPSPRSLTFGDEVKGYLLETWGRLWNDTEMEKEGLAIEKAAHPTRSLALAEQRLERFMNEYNLARAQRGPIDRRHTQ